MRDMQLQEFVSERLQLYLIISDFALLLSLYELILSIVLIINK